ncbi:Hypothetical predicted protein [Cloeon dipterum]|uniref:Uncharacterized protein n=1 Tax=Cloeon dipterum TaxID=197152 RepID=A0A8S1BS99_9INSE|nr:Hypothetical predicted protein [Cloeon dipterum]
MFPGKLQFAFIAGISAALGSVFGKLSGSPELLEVVPKHFIYANTQNQVLIEYLILIVQVLEFIPAGYCCQYSYKLYCLGNLRDHTVWRSNWFSMVDWNMSRNNWPGPDLKRSKICCED